MATTIRLTITETVTYGRDFTLEEAEMLAGQEWDDTDPSGFTMAFRAAVEQHSGLLEYIEHDGGEIQGQDWELEEV